MHQKRSQKVQISGGEYPQTPLDGLLANAHSLINRDCGIQSKV